MTNEEKAYEVHPYLPSNNGFTSEPIDLNSQVRTGFIEGAMWKDAQFKSILESEIERMKVDYPDTSTIQIRRYLEGLVEKLFKED